MTLHDAEGDLGGSRSEEEAFRKTVLQALDTKMRAARIPSMAPAMDALSVAERMFAAIPGTHPLDSKLGPFYDTAGLVKWLSVSRQYIHTLVVRGRVLGLKTADGELVYPAFQFDEHGGLLPELEKVLRILSRGTNSKWQQALWLVTPVDAWDGRSAVDLLRQRRSRDVMDAAQGDADRWAA